MQLHIATYGDLSTVLNWIPDARACRLWAGPLVPFPVSVEVLAGCIDFDKPCSYSLKQGAQLYGFGQLLPKEEGLLHMARIIVQPGLRGQGVGRRLCAALLQAAAGKNAVRVSLRVYRENLQALRLYRSLGFTVVPEARLNGSEFMVKDMTGFIDF